VARKLRIQFEKAFYHVVNRGNYRRDLFETAGAAQAFVNVLEEATLAYGWRIYAYVVMRNHFHIVMQTPTPNLVEGMHWLQSTLATRFNRYRSERGHLFQGRYHAGHIEDCRMLAHVVDYVHLNPVRAHIVSPDQAAAFRWSSLGRFVRGPRFEGLSAIEWLSMYALADKKEDWILYQNHLTELAGDLEKQKSLGWDKFSYGWALGTESWKADMSKEQSQKKLNPGLEASLLKDLREARWREALSWELAKCSHREEDLHQCRKNETWKVKIALTLRTQHGVACHWLARVMNLGTPGTARNLLSSAKRSIT